MCINPRIMNNGVSVGCRVCWQCRSNYINDWVGRCIAEGEEAASCHSVTLTYGADAHGNHDHERTAVLTYSDVQLYLKRLRKNGYPVRYFAVGEFGSAKGRAHWHIMLFWKDKVPHHEIRKRFNEPHWPHGYSYFDEVNSHSIRYVCKYIQKDLRDAERQRQIGMSKYPPLGASYFRKLARRYVDQGLSPRDPTYSFGDTRDKDGGIIQFRMRGATLDLFLAEFCRYWEKKRGGHTPVSPLLSDYYDRVAKPLHSLHMPAFGGKQEAPWIRAPAPMYFSDRHNAFACDLDGVTLFWSYDLKGDRAWQNVIRTEAQADRLREAYERRLSKRTYYDQSRGW